jgi:opacity protein-like surface antigen
MRRFAALAVLLSCPAIAAAQARSSEEAGPQLFGVLAVGWLTDDEGSLGSGLDIGAGVGYRWRGPLAAEAQLERLGTERRFESGVDFDARLFQLSGRLLYHFSAGKTEPYVGGAVGLTRFERTSVFPVLTPGPDGRPVRQGDEVFRRDGNEFTWGGVAGVRARAARRVQVRPEVAVLITRPSTFVVVSAGVKIGVEP